MKAGQNIMDNEILNFTERLIPISDFSKGKTSRIFVYFATFQGQNSHTQTFAFFKIPFFY